MSRTVTAHTVGDQITTLLTGFALTTAAREMVSRFVQADQQPALGRRLHELADGDFLHDATNVLAFGLPAPATYCYTSLSL